MPEWYILITWPVSIKFKSDVGVMPEWHKIPFYTSLVFQKVIPEWHKNEFGVSF